MITGSLQEKKGKYYMVLRLPTKEGKTKQKWISTGLDIKGNKRRAESLLKNTLVDYNRFDIQYSDYMLFEEFMKDWLENVAKLQIAVNTYLEYKRVIENNICSYFEGRYIYVQEITPKDIQKYYSYRLNQGVSGNTIKREHANIRKALQFAYMQGIIAYNPADRVELPKIEKFTGKVYTSAQIRRLLIEVRNTYMETPMLIATLYGLRRSEIIGLKWESIDFKENTIKIENTVINKSGKLIYKDKTKTESSNRVLYLIPELKMHLLRKRKSIAKNKKYFGSAYIESDYICVKADGELINPEHLSKKFRSICKELGLPKIRFHDLRHSVATILLEKGFSIKQVSEILGHSNISTTSNIYMHVSKESVSSMVETMSEAIL